MSKFYHNIIKHVLCIHVRSNERIRKALSIWHLPGLTAAEGGGGTSPALGLENKMLVPFWLLLYLKKRVMLIRSNLNHHKGFFKNKKTFKWQICPK